MNYKKIYDDLIQRGKSRTLSGYKERHHIVPRCMGGTDEMENLVDLTAEEHFVAHQLLVKIYPDEIKLALALKILMGSCNKTNKQFGWIRRKTVIASAKLHTGMKRSDTTKKNISNSLKGKRLGVSFTDEHKENLSKSLKGRIFTSKHRENLSKREITDEWKHNISISQKNRDWTGHADKIKAGITQSVRNKLSEKRKNAPKLTCPHCSKEVDSANFKRWHGTNCKVYKNGL